jgi:hypothetical protein
MRGAKRRSDEQRLADEFGDEPDGIVLHRRPCGVEPNHSVE